MCLKHIKVRSGHRKKQEMSRGITGCMTQCRSELGHETVDNAPPPPQRTFFQPPVRESDERIASVLLIHLAEGRFRAYMKRPLRQVLPRFRQPFPGLRLLNNRNWDGCGAGNKNSGG